MRRSRAEPHSLTFYLTHAPEGTTLADIMRIAGTRWTIESCFEQAKGEVALLPLTVPEVRHLLAAIAGPPPPDTAAILRWSLWRRRHQQRAHRAHWARQTRAKPKSETRL